jgi:hypothetical protein
MQFNYGEVFTLLGMAHGVPKEREPALRGRLQHLQKLGFPEGIKTGRGRPAKYGPAQVLGLLVAFELLQLGLTPERAARVVQYNLSVIAKAVRVTAREIGKEAEITPIYLIFEPQALHVPAIEFDDPALLSMRTQSAADLQANVGRFGATGMRRMGVINLSFVVLALGGYAEKLDYSRYEISGALMAWSAELSGAKA